MAKEAKLANQALVELIGTFLLTFVGASAIISTAYLYGTPQLLTVAFAHGIALALAVTMAMGISGGHINPAVTLGFLATGRISMKNAAIYIVAQVVGATLAGLVMMAIYPQVVGGFVNWGAPNLSRYTSALQGIAIEAVITFFLVFAVFGTAVDKRAPKMGGFGIGLMLAILIIAAGPFTGAAANPARALGPELASLYFANWYVYWIGPIVGGILAALFYDRFILGNR